MLAEGVNPSGNLIGFRTSADGEFLTAPGTLTALGYQQLTDLSSAAALDTYCGHGPGGG
jgi:hypothetical protein